MSGSDPYALLAAGSYLLPALVWAIIARSSWRFLLTKHPRSPFFRLLPIMTTIITSMYVFHGVLSLLPFDVQHHPGPLLVVAYTISNLAHVALGAVSLHLVHYLPLDEQPPSRRWLAIDYGIAAVVALFAIFPWLVPGHSFEQSLTRFFVIRNVYVLVMLALVLLQLARFSRRGMWHPGVLGEARFPDVFFIGCGVIGAVGWVLFALFADFLQPTPLWMRIYDTVIALLLATPLAVRTLGEVVRGVLVVGTLGAATAALYFGAQVMAASLVDPRLRPLVDVAAIVALLVVLVGGPSWVRAGIDHLVFRRSGRRREELRVFLQTLTPDLGAVECCRRGLAALARVLHLRSVAIILADGSSIAHGEFPLARIAPVWPRGAEADRLPAVGLTDYAMRELPGDVQEALLGTDVVAIVPVRSPRRRHGHLFMTTGFLTAAFSDEDVATVESFATQLALLLDGAELLARAVAVERTLAHNEKLAAIGALAARIAHEIRNPVTAARSLAQQLADEPGAAFAAEHELILTELERVERQVAALLRFARREEFTFAAVDLGDLTRTTLDAFRPRLAAADIALDLDAAGRIVARADAEKIRQLLINLVENAIDALGDGRAPRRLAIAVGGVNGSAVVRVSDSGSGIAAEALPHLFEPFFSLKPHGTGLGLAIAKRTVEAHGGTIEARSDAAGTTFHVTLPLGGPP